MIFEVLIAVSLVVCITCIVRQCIADGKIDWATWIPGEIVVIMIIALLSVLSSKIAFSCTTINDINPIAEYRIEENSPVVHSANGKYYLKYNGATTDISEPFIIAPSLTSKSTPTILICQVKPSFWVSPFCATQADGCIKYVLIISEEQIIQEVKPEEISEPMKNLPEWL